MHFSIRKLFLGISFNSCLFLMLMIGIQNSHFKDKVNFVINETIKLPLSFILGSSFITGSILGSFVDLNFLNREKKK